MRKPLACFVGALGAATIFLNGATLSNASEWVFAQNKGSSVYRVSHDITSEQDAAVSIRYECDAQTGQRLDIVAPRRIFDPRFFDDESVGIVWHSDEIAKWPGPNDFNHGAVFEQVKVDRSSDRDRGNIVLSLKSGGVKVLESARRLSRADQPVAIGLFKLGRKIPVRQSDIVLKLQVPAKGAAEALEKAYSFCDLAY